MGSGEGLPEAPAGGPPCIALHVLASAFLPQGMVSSLHQEFTRRWKRKEKALSPCVFLT